MHSEQQYWFLRNCGKGCETKIQMKTACKKLEAAFGCPLHGPHGKGMSKVQAAATHVVSTLPGAGSVAVEQYCALDIACKPVDILLPEHSLMIEVDPKLHEPQAGGWEEAGEQFSRDRAFDKGVLAANKRLLRLSGRDQASWGKHVLAAIKRAEQEPEKGFVYYSHSYEDSWRVQE